MCCMNRYIDIDIVIIFLNNVNTDFLRQTLSIQTLFVLMYARIIQAH